MPIPSQPATTDNSIHTFNTQPLLELLTRSSVLQDHSRHPPNHIIFRSQESLQINLFHRPSFTSIHQHPLNTRSIYLSFYSQGSSPRCQQHFKVHELSPSTFPPQQNESPRKYHTKAKNDLQSSAPLRWVAGVGNAMLVDTMGVPAVSHATPPKEDSGKR